VQVGPNIELDDVSLSDCPALKNTTKIRVFPSAVAIYYAPSDLSGTRGMFRERIRAVDSWRHGPGRHDCVFVQHDPDQLGFRGKGAPGSETRTGGRIIFFANSWWTN